jgi:tetratricopeptide (TPR) repeat protein
MDFTDDQAGRRIEAGLAAAADQLEHGNPQTAIEILRQVLSQAPELSPAHALLALTLLHQKRIHAARSEAQMAVTLDPESALAHRALGLVHIAHRSLGAAKKELDLAIELAPDDATNHRVRAALSVLEGRRKEARASLEHARKLDPEDTDSIVAMGNLELSEGRVDSAEARAREALEILPEHVDGLVLMGKVLLRRGKIAEAREHAIWALRRAAADADALGLLVAVKARESLALGLWWRFNTWLGELGDGRAVLVLLCAFVVQRALVLWANQNHHAMTAQIVGVAWLAICAYTWVGPGLFKRALSKELDRVALREF